MLQVEVDAADCAILRATPSFICSGDTSGNVWSLFICLQFLLMYQFIQSVCQPQSHWGREKALYWANSKLHSTAGHVVISYDCCYCGLQLCKNYFRFVCGLVVLNQIGTHVSGATYVGILHTAANEYW